MHVITDLQKNAAMLALSRGKDGTAASDADQEHFEVLLEALDIFLVRNQERRNLWKDGGAPDSLHHLRSKVARIKQLLDHPDARSHLTPRQLAELEDDALDAINYLVFLVLNARADRLDGEI